MFTIKDMKQPSSVAAALQMLAEVPNLVPLAGGTDIIPKVHKQPHIEQLKSSTTVLPKRENIILLNLSGLDELNGISKESGFIKIGALTTHSAIGANRLIQTHYPMLSKAASVIGSVQIRNRGTIGGNIVNASPAADLVAPLVAAGAKLTLISVKREHQIRIENFASGPGKTIKDPDELLSFISIPLPSANNIQFYKRLAPRKAQGISKVSIAFYANLENRKLANVKIALGAVGPTVILARKTASFLEQKIVDSALIEQAAEIIKTEISPVSDIRSTAEYRKAMAAELFRQGLWVKG